MADGPTYRATPKRPPRPNVVAKRAHSDALHIPYAHAHAIGSVVRPLFLCHALAESKDRPIFASSYPRGCRRSILPELMHFRPHCYGIRPLRLRGLFPFRKETPWYSCVFLYEYSLKFFFFLSKIALKKHATPTQDPAFRSSVPRNTLTVRK